MVNGWNNDLGVGDMIWREKNHATAKHVSQLTSSSCPTLWVFQPERTRNHLGVAPQVNRSYVTANHLKYSLLLPDVLRAESVISSGCCASVNTTVHWHIVEIPETSDVHAILSGFTVEKSVNVFIRVTFQVR